jgi:hypothetical protein
MPNNWKLKLFLKRFPVKTSILVLFLILTLLFKRFYLDNIPMLFWGADILGILFENVTFGIVASLFFYIGTVYRQQFEKEVDFALLSNRYVNVIRSRINHITSCLTYPNSQFPSDPGELRLSLSRKTFLGEAPFGWNDQMHNATWREFLFFIVKSIDIDATKIISTLNSHQVYNQELLHLLEQILSSSFVTRVKWCASAKLQDSDLACLTKEFLEYQNLIHEVILIYENQYNLKK